MARRGNPNWMRAAEERRSALARREEVVAKKRESEFVATVAPILGAAAGALGVVVAAEKLGVDRERIAIGAAVMGLATAASSKGWARGIAAGVAAAGASIAIVQRLSPAKETESPKRDPNAGGITREELLSTLAEFSQRQRNARVEGGPVNDAPSNAAAETSAVGEATSREVARTSQPRESAERITRFREVVSRLDDGERSQLHRFIDAAPDDTLEVAQQFLVEMAPDDAVQYLREYVLPRVAA